MKKILLLFLMIAAFGLSAKLRAQCTVTNVKVKLNSTQTSGSNCIVNFDLSFNLQHNNGNKYIWIHIWRGTNYPNLSYSKPPTRTQLANSLANIGINNDVNPAQFQASYVPDPLNPPTPDPIVQTNGTISIIAGTPDLFTITGVQITVPAACNTIIPLTADVWSSQSSSQNAVHCVNKGISFVANDPKVTGLLFCPQPRQYSVTISTLSTTAQSGTYNVYRDDNNDAILNPLTDAIVATNIAWSAVSGTPYQSGQQSYAGNNAAPTANRPLFIEVSTAGQANTVYTFLPNSCIPLPVSFKSFSATRNNSNVSLKWETASEQNSTGFAIERNTNGTWEQIAFVPSQAPGGNSNSTLSYQYNDLNNVKGISQYRVRQVDFDARAKYSEIKAVRGDGQIGKTIVYPNPSFNGRLTVVFEDATTTRDASLTDLSGRIVKQWKNITNNNIQIENLAPGMYNLRIVVPSTGAQTIEKIIVNKR